jgi:uncharacterized protein (TIGR02001 family)
LPAGRDFDARRQIRAASREFLSARGLAAPERREAMRKRTRSAASAGVLTATLLIAAATANAQDEGARWSGEVTLASEYVLRGVAQTRGGAALQAGVGYAGRALTAGAWGSTVDFVDAPAGSSDGTDGELDLYLSRAWQPAARLAIDTTLVRYVYVDTAPGFDYDYNEIIVAWRWSDAVSGSIYWSNDAYASGRSGVGYEIGVERTLPGGVLLSALAGHYDLDRVFGASYSYWHAGVARDFGPLAVALRYEASNGAGERLWGDAAQGRLVLTLGVAM